MSNITGTIIKLFPVKAINEKFSVREFVVETSDNPKYPQKILLQSTGKAIEFLAKFKEGDSVDVTYDLRGREYSRDGNTKYFNTINAWKISAATDTPATDDDPWAGVPG